MIPPYPTFDGTQPCRDNPDVFFPDGTNTHYALIAAKEICAPCPFAEACLSYALAHDVKGIWAGTSTGSRRTYRAERGLKAVPIVPTDAELNRMLIDEYDDGVRTNGEIAAAVGCSVKTVDRALHAKYGHRPAVRRAVA